MSIKLSFHGGVDGVTGSCHLLEAGGLNILVDCGFFQGGYDVVYQLEDGTFIDADGNPIEVPHGYKFVKSKKLKEAMLDTLMGT